MGLSNGLFGLLVTISVTCLLSPTLLRLSSSIRLDGNNGEALLHIVISTEVVFLRGPTAPGLVDSFALAQVLENLTIWFSLLHDW